MELAVWARGSPTLLGVLVGGGSEGMSPAQGDRPQDGSNDLQHPSTRLEGVGTAAPSSPPGSKDIPDHLSWLPIHVSDMTQLLLFLDAPQRSTSGSEPATGVLLHHPDAGKSKSVLFPLEQPCTGLLEAVSQAPLASNGRRCY